MMRILCAYNGTPKLRPETHYALSRYADGHQVDFVDVSRSKTAYWHAIRERWTGEEDLVTVEEDNVIAAENMPSFASCDRDWCCYTYAGPPWLPPEVGGQMRFSLGCTRFSAALQKRIPPDQIAGDYMVWYLIDERFQMLFRLHGYEPHVHGEVVHLHDYNADMTPKEQEDAAFLFEIIRNDHQWTDEVYRSARK